MHLSCHLATILYTFFFVNMHAGKNLQSSIFLEFFFLGENNRKLLYGSLTLLKVNLLTENRFLTCCHTHKSAKVFTKSYLNILHQIFLKLSVMNWSSPIETAYENQSWGSFIYLLYNQVLGCVPCVLLFVPKYPCFFYYTVH